MWFDSHAHLERAGGLEALERARAAGVTRVVSVGTGAETSAAAASLAEAAGDGVWATAGLHPHDAVDGLAGFDELWSRAEVVAVGECGLDYHYDHSPRPAQREAFAAQVGAAHRFGLALVVHTRDAWDDTVAILRSEGVPERTVIHCFSGGPAEAARCLELGAHLSFSGIVTFAKADDVREAAREAPLERILVETDSPFLAPVPHRGRENEPAFVALVGEAVAGVKGLAVKAVAEATTANASRVFGVD